jgi:YVTN family beta-propeller protein
VDPVAIAVNYPADTMYVANAASDSVSVINLTTNKKIVRDVPVGVEPQDIATNDYTNTTYVLNAGSNGISVLDAEVNKVMAGIKFNISPANAGHVTCNGMETPINQYLYVSSGTNCTANPNQGFGFTSWVENLNHNSTRTINTTSLSNSPWNSLKGIFGFKQNDTSAILDITTFGNFTANFKALPPPIPSDYVLGLFTIVASTIVGWSLPTIIGSINSKKQSNVVSRYHQRIKSNIKYDDDKIDEKDIKDLDERKDDIADDYSKAKINEKHYESLKCEISILYEKIFRKMINSLDNPSNKETTEK